MDRVKIRFRATFLSVCPNAPAPVMLQSPGPAERNNQPGWLPAEEQKDG